MSLPMTETTTLITATLGLDPFLLVQLTEGDDGEIKASLTFGGGISAEDVPELLDMLLEAATPVASTADRSTAGAA